MTNPLWPDWLDEVWAKSPVGDGDPGESLAQHTWQVLSRLSEMIDLRPYLPEMVGFSGLWNSLFWACLLHDFGKAARGFQDWMRGGPRWPHRHEVLSLAFLEWIEGTFSREDVLFTAAAVVYHHRDASEISLLYLDLGGDSPDAFASLVDEIEDLVLSGLWRWINDCMTEWIKSLNFSPAGVQLPILMSLDKALALFREEGAQSISKRLKALRRWEREINRLRTSDLITRLLVLRGHIHSCDHTASAHTSLLIQSPLHSPGQLPARMGIPEAGLYPHQKACMETLGPAVLVSPTGSGKTESALLWACSQVFGGKPPSRLFYTLPYQASMNAIYDRLNEKYFPGCVGLDHSRSILALYRRFLEENYNRQHAVRLATLAKKLSRLHYFPVRVLSPYQILKAPYKLKGYEALLTDFFGAAFVFDEVHAYEVDRLAAILATIKYLRENFGARFFVMSATLPDMLMNRLADAIGSKTVIKATPEVFNEFQRHRLQVLEGDLFQEKWLERIVKEAVGGGSVLVCCNTVARAQQAYRELGQRLKCRREVVLLHGRFNGHDRLNKEGVVQKASGTRSDERRPVVLVATQVVEVSLDIDLDVIYTDPAPLEALIQRFGRINRRRSKKWAPVNVFSDPCDGQRIYDKDLVLRSLMILKKHTGKMIDEAEISGWLDEIYGGEAAVWWNVAYQRAYEQFEEICLRTLRPFNAVRNLEELFYRAFDSIEVLPAGLEKDYDGLMAEEPLEASQLLVPLSWGQFCNIQKKGMVRDYKNGWVKVVELPYDNETGLHV